jgi:glycosyltransferase involved in cell wall biosynthesis
VRTAYVTTYDSSNPRAWSGLGYHISRCLELAGLDVTRIGPLASARDPVARMWQIAAKLRGRTYDLARHPRNAKAYAAEVARRLESAPCDVVFSPGTIPIAHLNTGHPVAFWADATFGAMVGFYPQTRSLSKRAIRAGSDLEARALRRASAAFYASEWAARSAVEDHRAEPEKVEVVPFGANMPITHSRERVAETVRGRPVDSCRLLFVGVDWARKGGGRAVDVARVLNKRGLRTELHVVGSTPDEVRRLPPWVHLHGFVDKSSEPGASRMRTLYASSHFLIHPAIAECFGVVFCEAAGHGVLSAASRVGGIPSAVREGVTGALFDVLASSEEYADYVWRMLQDRSGYETAAVGAFDEYRSCLSWEAHAQRVGARLAELA